MQPSDVARPLAWALGLAIAAILSVPSRAADVAKGGKLARMWCVECDLIDDDAAKSMDAAPQFRRLANDPAKSQDVLRGFLFHPTRPMPPLELSRREIDDLVAFIKGLATE